MAIGSIFLSTALLSFAFALLLAGLFGAFYGQGRSRAVGFLLALFAILLGGLFAALTWPILPGMTPMFEPGAVADSAVAVLAGTMGTALAILAFVVAVMRS